MDICQTYSHTYISCYFMCGNIFRRPGFPMVLEKMPSHTQHTAWRRQSKHGYWPPRARAATWKKRKESSAKTPAGRHCSQACSTPPVKATWQCRQRPWEEPLEMKGRVPECVLTNRRVEGVPVFEYWACLNTGLTTVVSQFCQMSGTTGQQPRGVSHTPAGPAVKTANHTDHHHMLQQ